MLNCALFSFRDVFGWENNDEHPMIKCRVSSEMKSNNRMQVLITGGSSGIGLELAKQFAVDGYEILLVASNEERLLRAKKMLTHQYSVPVSTYTFDLAKQGMAERLYEAVKADGHVIDVLVNNAGIGTIGATEEIPLVKDEALMMLNMMAPVVLTKLFLREMYGRKTGRILNVCSTGAYQPGPYTATYYASKSFLLSYTKAVRFESKQHGVSVCALCPGTTDTGFFTRADSKTPKGAMSAEKVAFYAYKHFMRGKAEIIPGLSFRLMKLCPVSIKTAVVAWVKRPKSS